MTEEEARKKICPLVAISTMIGASAMAMANKGTTFNPETNCIASDCMMWVWYLDVCSPEAKEYNKGKGYCGLRR